MFDTIRAELDALEREQCQASHVLLLILKKCGDLYLEFEGRTGDGYQIASRNMCMHTTMGAIWTNVEIAQAAQTLLDEMTNWGGPRSVVVKIMLKQLALASDDPRGRLPQKAA